MSGSWCTRTCARSTSRSCPAAIEKQILIGDPFDDATTLGPLNNEPTVAKTERHVRDAVDHGAVVLAGGEPRAEPRQRPVLRGDRDRRRHTRHGDRPRRRRSVLWRPVSTIRSVDEAIDAVNGSPYGLLTAIFTRDLGRGLRFAEAVRAGWVNVNEGTNYWESHLPFGGRAGSQSGVGRVGGASRWIA